METKYRPCHLIKRTWKLINLDSCAKYVFQNSIQTSMGNKSGINFFLIGDFKSN